MSNSFVDIPEARCRIGSVINLCEMANTRSGVMRDDRTSGNVYIPLLPSEILFLIFPILNELLEATVPQTVRGILVICLATLRAKFVTHFLF